MNSEPQLHPRAIASSHGRLWARWALDPVLGALDGIYLEWDDGVFTRVEPAGRPPHDCPREACHDNCLLTPGLLNAHAHLDYSYLRGALPGIRGTGVSPVDSDHGRDPRATGFIPWLRAMIESRRALREEDAPARREACLRGLDELLASGATEVWDISSFGWARAALRESAARAITFEELIAPRAAAFEPAWAAWQARFHRECLPLGPATRERLAAGISPHTTYSVAPPVLQRAAAFASRHRLPLAIHLAESPEEKRLLETGDGPLADLLAFISGTDPAAELGAGASPIQRAAQAGALGPQTLAIHCNLPSPGDAGLLEAAGAVVVFCPRSHAFFGYPEYPLKEYRKHRVRLALGTDSLASNDSLDMREELRVFAALATDWRPLEIFKTATGAALGERPPYGGRGRLEEWKPAQWALWELPAPLAHPSAEALFQTFLSPQTRLSASSALEC